MNTADGKGNAGIGEGREEFSDKVWFDGVVRVDEVNKCASGGFEAGVTSGGLALVFLMNDFDAGVFFGVAISYFR